MELEQVIIRFDLDCFTDALGVEAMQFLETLNFNLRKENLTKILLGTFPRDSILQNSKIRKAVFSVLKKDEAVGLASEMGFSSGNPWDYLKSQSYRRGGKNLKTLYSWFKMEQAEPENPFFQGKPVEKVSGKYPLFEHQRKALSQVLEILDKQTSNPRVLLHMPTGSGKTRTVMNVVCKYLRDDAETKDIVIWLAHSEELCTQAAEEFKKAWEIIGNREINIFRKYSEHKAELNSVEEGILFFGLQSADLALKKKSDEVLNLSSKTIMVVMDEAHKAIAPTYQHILDILCRNNRTILIGLSATPGRSFLDPREDIKLADFFNWKKVKLETSGDGSPIGYLVNKGYLAEIDYEPLGHSPDLSDEEIGRLEKTFDIPQEVLKKLEKDQARNLKIVHKIQSELTIERKMLVFACSVGHSNFLATVLRGLNLKAQSVTSETSVNLRRQYIDEYKNSDKVQILVNYGVLTTGFDAPKTNIAIIARPTKSIVLYSQMVGRAARGIKAGGNKLCKVITVQDKIRGFRNIDESFSFWEDIWELKT